MNTVLSKLIGDRKEWKRMEARARALPRDYRTVYDAMKSYLWIFTAGDGMDIVEILKDVLTTFEAGAAEGKPVRGITGPDVAAYCDTLVPNGPAFLNQRRARLNREVAGEIGD